MLIIYHIIMWLKVRLYSLKCFPSQHKQTRYWPAPRFHRDRRYWRRGRRSSWLGPVHTTWRLETQRGRRTLQEEGEEVRSRARSFSPLGLSSVDPCGDPHRAETHSSHHSRGNHLLKNEAERTENKPVIDRGRAKREAFSGRRRHWQEKQISSQDKNSTWSVLVVITAPLNCHCVEDRLTLITHHPKNISSLIIPQISGD